MMDIANQLLRGWDEIALCLRVSRERARNMVNFGAPIITDKVNTPRADSEKLKEWFLENADRV